MVPSSADIVLQNRRISQSETSTINICTDVKGTIYHFRVIVVANDVENLLSRGVASRMSLVRKLDVITDGVGCLKTEPVRIVLKEDAQPSALTVARRVWYLQGLLKL